MSAISKPPAARPGRKPADPPRGRWVLVMTPEERAADMEAFGREIRKSKATAIAFLQSANILDENGELIAPLRS